MLKLGSRSRAVVLGLVLLAAGLRAQGASPTLGPEANTAHYLDTVRDKPVALAIFLRELPKGGDLHNHLAGAIYAENLIGWGVDEGLCVHLPDLTLAWTTCDPDHGRPLLSQALAESPGLYHDLIDAFSMRDFIPHAGLSGHDQFFGSFNRFGPALAGHTPQMIAEAANRAAADHVDYLELMDSPGMAAARSVARAVAWRDDLDALYAQFAPVLAPLADRTRSEIAADYRKARQIMRCETAAAEPGCGVQIRYIAQVIRTFPPAEVFAEIQFGYALAATDPKVVGVNLVAPEDDPVTLRDYAKQMAMLAYMGRRYPTVRLTLHAGELTQGLAPPEDLSHHIRDAVDIAGARRIGHGVDLRYEAGAADLLREMAARKVLVEINLTSNDVILGVKGDDHPFLDYRAAGVPLALSTDDEGVSRIDLTHEFVRAVQTYRLSYADLKSMIRNSLEYGFLPGRSLWVATAPYRIDPACARGETTACAALLNASEKARLEWRLEGELKAFEARPWPGS
jgi:adenosine deaminase